MPHDLTLSLTLFILTLSHGCSGSRSQLYPRCDIKRLTAAEPSLTIKNDAGVEEIWDNQLPEFLCTGVIATRLTISSGGLLLPVLNNAPAISIIQQGSGIVGQVLPGCSDTVQSEYQAPGGAKKTDHHQKLFRIAEGDVISSPTNIVQWIYNDDVGDIIIVTFNYFLSSQLDPGFSVSNQLSQQSEDNSGINGGRLLSGFDTDILEYAFGVDRETVLKIAARNDANIFVCVPDLQLQISEEQQDGVNGGEESLCKLKFIQNLNNSSQSKSIDSSAARINTINGETLPILQTIRLSTAQIVLDKNAILGPQWTVNANTAVYVTKGDGKVSVANNEGDAVFDDVVQRGQILVIPQGFPVVVKAGGEGMEWLEMRTNDNAVISRVAGKNSVLGAIPVEVLAKGYNISVEQAIKLKKE